MKLEQQVCSLELAKKLKELGVKQESLYYWSQIQSSEWSIRFDHELMETVEGGEGWTYLEEGLGRGDVCSSFTVAELGELMPYWLDIEGAPQLCCYGQGKTLQAVDLEKSQIAEYNGTLLEWKADTEADARAKMLVYLLENKLITL